MLIGGRTKMADDDCAWLKMKDSFSIDHIPRVWQKPATEKHTRHVFCPPSLAGPSSRPAHPTSSVPLERGQKWLKFTSCIFIIALWCKMCRKCLPLLSLKTLESVQMHCELGKLSCHFTVDIELSICLFFPPPPPSLTTFIILTKNPPFYVERFSEESQTLIQYVWAQMPPDLIVLVSLFMLSANAPLNHLDCCWILREFKLVKLRHKDLSAWMLRICVQHTT